ncbi:MAG TPA: DUF1360 domain-containing protein [Thermoleophilaceae bacterium]|jgi:hypothetical protein|nr:DUF1360 domain-containing protein [Thermoleophilaceae bacterium]
MDGYSPHKHIPLASYGIVAGVFTAASAAYVEAHRRSGRSLPGKLPLGDFMILAAATQKLSRLIAKERVTSFLRSPFTRYTGEAGPSEVSEEPRGTGLRRSIGELLICPYCVGHWVAAAAVGAYVRDPDATRMVAGVFAVLSASDFLNQAWVALEERT